MAMTSRMAWWVWPMALAWMVGAQPVQDAKTSEIVEYHSLVGPFISEWWQGGLPHWDFGAATVVTDRYIRVAPAKQSRVGWLWNEQPSHLFQWEATLTMRIHSRRNPGADGMALWYADRPVKYDPNSKEHEEKLKLWGNSADFKGLGIIFDSYDNDGQRDNPVVTVIQGTGDPNQKWDLDQDLTPQAKLRCVYEFRNTPKGDNVIARVVYAEKSVQVYISTSNDGRETFCGQAKDIYLPTGYYFGLTATTGHLADNHDVLSFVVKAAPDAILKEDEKIYGDPNAQRAVPEAHH